MYIGITCQKPEYRWKNGKGYKNNCYFFRAILKHGWDNIKHEILFTNLTKEEACEKEMQLIKKYKSNEFKFGYNNSTGGDGGTSGVKLSAETRRRMSVSRKGKYYGQRRKHTQEEKDKIRNKLKGRPSPMKNKQWTVEQRARVGFAIFCKELNQTYYSIREAERQTGVSRRSIARNLKHECEKARGLTFEFKKQSR